MKNGVLKCTSADKDPVLVHPDLAVGALYISGVAIRLRADTNSRGQVYVVTQNGEAAFRYVQDFDYPASDDFQIYVIPFKEDTLVHPVLSRLRIDPAIAPDVTVEIDWIALIDSGIPTPTPIVTPIPSPTPKPADVAPWRLH